MAEEKEIKTASDSKTAPTVPAATPSATPPVASAPPPKKKKGCLILAIIIIVLFLLSFSRGIFSLISSNNDNSNVEIPVDPNSNTTATKTDQNSSTPTKTDTSKNSKTTTTAPSTTAPSLTKKEAIEYMIAVGMKGDDGKGPDRVISKWIKPSVSFKVLGSPSASSSACVDSVVGDLNALIDPVSFSRNDAAADFDVTVRFITSAELNEVYGRLGTPAPNNLHGYMTLEWNHQGNEELIGGHIYIATDSPISDIVRCAVIRHEMTHTIGLPFNSVLYVYSIFGPGYEGRSDYIEIDKEAIRQLYNFGLPVGSTESQVRSFFGI